MRKIFFEPGSGEIAADDEGLVNMKEKFGNSSDGKNKKKFGYPE